MEIILSLWLTPPMVEHTHTHSHTITRTHTNMCLSPGSLREPQHLHNDCDFVEQSRILCVCACTSELRSLLSVHGRKGCPYPTHTHMHTVPYASCSSIAEMLFTCAKHAGHLVPFTFSWKRRYLSVTLMSFLLFCTGSSDHGA